MPRRFRQLRSRMGQRAPSPGKLPARVAYHVASACVLSWMSSCFGCARPSLPSATSNSYWCGRALQHVIRGGKAVHSSRHCQHTSHLLEFPRWRICDQVREGKLSRPNLLVAGQPCKHMPNPHALGEAWLVRRDNWENATRQSLVDVEIANQAVYRRVGSCSNASSPCLSVLDPRCNTLI